MSEFFVWIGSYGWVQETQKHGVLQAELLSIGRIDWSGHTILYHNEVGHVHDFIRIL